jgi:hypothetical protein
MKHSNRMIPYMIGAAVFAVVMLAFGAPRISLAPLLFVIVCPLMMFMMMRGMGGMSGKETPEDHTGHGCEHDPTRKSDTSGDRRT